MKLNVRRFVWAVALLGVILVDSPRGLTATKTSFKLEGWLNLSQTWGGSFNGSNSRLNEGDVVNLRFVGSLASGSANTIYLTGLFN